MSSVCGLLGSVGTAGYSAAKAGMIALSRNAAIEWGKRGAGEHGHTRRVPDTAHAGVDAR